MSIEKIRNIGLDKLVTQVYDFDSLTTDELLCKFAQKLNIVIEHFNYYTNNYETKLEKYKMIIDNNTKEIEKLKEEIAKLKGGV